MKYSAIILSLITATTSTFAADERSAAQIARKFSETIACQIQDTQIQRNQYKAVKVLQGDKDLGGLGDIFVVYWEGDIGCAGGNGTVTANFTIVEQKGFSTVPPVVVFDYTFPELDLAQVTNISGKSGSLQINGIAYGPNDQQGYPTKRVAYNLKLDQASGAFVKR